jgi:formylglycine-generating enzyme required for sulfatase activity
MSSCCDRSGFPLLPVPALRLVVHLLPVTKVQFEAFLAEPNAYGDQWYEELLALNPRVSYRTFGVQDRERLLLSGVLPQEALAFAHWLGPGFDLPTVAEWRGIARALAAEPASSAPLVNCCAVACETVQRIVGQLKPRHLLDVSLLQGGLVEWARAASGYVGLGTPRQEFQPNLWDPFTEEVRPLRPQQRLRAFGFRLVRREP